MVNGRFTKAIALIITAFLLVYIFKFYFDLSLICECQCASFSCDSNPRGHQTKTRPANVSVLSDPYYVLQRNDPLFDPKSWPKCVRITSSPVTKYSICPWSTKEFMFNEAIFYGLWERFEPQIMIRLLNKFPDLAYIDIGANMGLWAIPIMTATHKKRKLIAVEANPDNVQQLLAGLTENGVPKENYAIIHRAMLDNVDEKVKLSQTWKALNTTLLTNHGIVGKINDPHKFFDGELKHVISSASIESHVLPVAKAMGIKSAILKFDIEGSECLAFKTLPKFLNEINVPLIAFEYCPGHHIGQCLDDIRNILTQHNYIPYRSTVAGVLAMWDASEMEKWSPWANLNIMWMKFAV